MFITISVMCALLGLNTKDAHWDLQPADYNFTGIIEGRVYGWPWRFLTVWQPPSDPSRFTTEPPDLNWMALAGDLTVWVAILAVTLWIVGRIWPATHS